MKKNYDFLSIALVICLTLFLGGCASKNAEISNTGDTETQPAVTTATETEDNNPEDDADVVTADMADETIMTIETPEDTPVESDYPAPASETASGLQISVDYQRSTERATNQVALWVEDSSETLVKTIFVSDFVGSRRGYTRREMALSGWQLAAKPETMTDEEVDAVSGATPQSGKLNFVWDFTDSNGEPVPDGRYRIPLEGNLYWESEILYTIEFDLSEGQVRNITTNVERSQPDEHTNEEMLTNLEVSVING